MTGLSPRSFLEPGKTETPQFRCSSADCPLRAGISGDVGISAYNCWPDRRTQQCLDASERLCYRYPNPERTRTLPVPCLPARVPSSSEYLLGSRPRITPFRPNCQDHVACLGCLLLLLLLLFIIIIIMDVYYYKGRKLPHSGRTVKTTLPVSDVLLPVLCLSWMFRPAELSRPRCLSWFFSCFLTPSPSSKLPVSPRSGDRPLASLLLEPKNLRVTTRFIYMIDCFNFNHILFPGPLDS